VFSPNVYHGGALVLYALREVIGERAFARLERAWTKRYRGQSASTEDFIELASRVARRDLTAFLEDWLYGTATPPMPNHPDEPGRGARPRGERVPKRGRRDARR
jgi:aminopeptidase N